MVEIIKAWIQRRRKKKQAAKERQAAAELIEHIEQALNLELYEWQRLYIITGIWQPPEGRQHGRTLAYIVRLLIDQSKPLLIYGISDARAYADNPFTERQYMPVPTVYADGFRRDLQEIYEQLRAAGVPVRELVFKHGRDGAGISW